MSICCIVYQDPRVPDVQVNVYVFGMGTLLGLMHVKLKGKQKQLIPGEEGPLVWREEGGKLKSKGEAHELPFREAEPPL